MMRINVTYRRFYFEFISRDFILQWQNSWSLQQPCCLLQGAHKIVLSRLRFDSCISLVRRCFDWNSTVFMYLVSCPGFMFWLSELLANSEQLTVENLFGNNFAHNRLLSFLRYVDFFRQIQCFVGSVSMILV